MDAVIKIFFGGQKQKFEARRLLDIRFGVSKRRGYWRCSPGGTGDVGMEQIETSSTQWKNCAFPIGEVIVIRGHGSVRAAMGTFLLIFEMFVNVSVNSNEFGQGGSMSGS